MNVARRVGRYRVGDWEFFEASGELRRRTEVRRLEPRAAKALQILCDANGDVVSQERLISDVWGGRSLSDNSVAVVIGQLRKMLDDDAREPRMIETIPKRGYRLRIDREPMGPASRRPSLIISGILAAVMLAAGSIWLWSAQSPALAVAVRDVANETGDPAYEPLARATSELIVNELGQRGYAVRRSGEEKLVLAPKLIMWDAKPFLSVTMTDRTGVVRWSLMANALPGRVPPAIDEAFDDLARQIPPNDGAERLAEPASAR